MFLFVKDVCEENSPACLHQIDYAAFFCCVGLIGGAIGNTGVNYFVKKYKKTWFVVAILTFVLFLSVFLMGYAGYVRWAVAEHHGKNMGLRSLCPSHLKPHIALGNSAAH